MSSTPPTPEATKELLEKIGPIRNTHYGGFYDFIPDLSSKDTAYTNEALSPHTDTTYFTEPAGLQAFHLLGHTPPPNGTAAGAGDGGIGGESILVDGFDAATKLFSQNEQQYHSLLERVPWHASGNEGISISPDRSYPVLESGRFGLSRIRWNNDDRGVVRLSPRTKSWYEAANAWQHILSQTNNQYRFQLVPGRVLSMSDTLLLTYRLLCS